MIQPQETLLRDKRNEKVIGNTPTVNDSGPPHQCWIVELMVGGSAIRKLGRNLTPPPSAGAATPSIRKYAHLSANPLTTLFRTPKMTAWWNSDRRDHFALSRG